MVLDGFTPSCSPPHNSFELDGAVHVNVDKTTRREYERLIAKFSRVSQRIIVELNERSLCCNWYEERYCQTGGPHCKLYGKSTTFSSRHNVISSKKHPNPGSSVTTNGGYLEPPKSSEEDNPLNRKAKNCNIPR